VQELASTLAHRGALEDMIKARHNHLLCRVCSVKDCGCLKATCGGHAEQKWLAACLIADKCMTGGEVSRRHDGGGGLVSQARGGRVPADNKGGRRPDRPTAMVPDSLRMATAPDSLEIPVRATTFANKARRRTDISTRQERPSAMAMRQNRLAADHLYSTLKTQTPSQIKTLILRGQHLSTGTGGTAEQASLRRE